MQKENKNIKLQNFIYKYILFILILIIAVYLRFYNIFQLFPFSGEVGDNLLSIKNAYINKQIPLLGPPTSHPWLYFGPFFYWIYGPVLILSKFNPLSYAIFGAIGSVLIVLLNFLFIKTVFNLRTALISSYLLAISPLMLEFSRGARFFSLVTLLVYPFLYLLYKICVNQSNKYILLGLILGLMFSFHFTPLMLFPFIFSVLFIQKISIKSNAMLKIIAGFLISMSPFFIYDITHNFSMTLNIILWIPYRIAGFIGLIPKNTVSTKVIQDNILSFNQYIAKSFLYDPNYFLSLLLLLIFVLITLSLISKYMSNKYEFKIIYILIWTFWGLLAVFIHGNPPIHYFVPILPAVIIILSIFIDNYFTNKYAKLIFLSFIAVITIFNFKNYYSDKWFYKNISKMSVNPFFVPYTLQKSVAKKIIIDAKGSKYSLRRNGLDDMFDLDYAQNYIYLLWLYGNEPVRNAKLEYTIYEYQENKPINISNSIKVGNIFIKKNEK